MPVPGCASFRHRARSLANGQSEHNFDRGDVTAFLSAGAVLFASLVIGSSVSLIFSGTNELIGAILEGFLELGLWALAGFIVAIVAALIIAVRTA